MPVNAGPIPGENYTSDTKNYPWRQPPEFSDIDEALDYMSGRMTQFKVANGLLTMAEMGFPLYKVASMILMQGVGEGKFTPDFALLLAGPVTRIIELMCIGFDVDYDLGINDDDDDFETGTFFKHDKEMKLPKTMQLLDEELPDIKTEAEQQASTGQTQDLQQEGFMAMSGGNPNDDQQNPGGSEEE
ncbi:hypothetical protein EVB99_091 [Rhizobium phage RHph_N3_19]|nr:hypothetical protein EVB99_091 [Rhizobium phage RHph_N3_19]